MLTSDQDRIPTEIVKHCLSFFDDKTARIARLACTDWFKWIQYSKFNIHFARADTLPQMIDRLSKYQYPIDLALVRHMNMTPGAIIEEISKLTQLRSVKCFGGDNSSYYFPPQRFYPLTVLTNLEELDINDCECPQELLHHFPRIRKVRCDDKEDLETVLMKCKNIEYIYGILDKYLDALPVTVKKLALNSSPYTNWIKLTKLTNLKKLRSFSEHSIDLTGITWIENLAAGTANIKGLEFCNHLTRLYVEDREAELFTVPELPNLEKLHLNVLNYDGTHMANMTRLTSLKIDGLADLTTLGTSLQYLNLSVTQEQDLSNMTRLEQLTQLIIETNGHDLQPLSNLTNLESLQCENNAGEMSKFHLSNLQNLTYLTILGMDIDANTMQRFTKLQYLNISANIDTDLWNSLSHLTNLTSLTVRPTGEVPTIDYTVISKLPLKELNLDTFHKENEVAVVANLTTLESLVIHINEDDEISELTTLKNLTALEVSRNSSNVTGIHLTSLTSLQKIHVNFKADITETDLKSKLTRLFDLYISDE